MNGSFRHVSLPSALTLTDHRWLPDDHSLTTP